MTRAEVEALLRNQRDAAARRGSEDPVAPARSQVNSRAPLPDAQRLLTFEHPVAMDAALDRGGVRLEIPLPPSWNRVFKARAMPIGGGRFTAQVYKTAEGKEYAEKVQALCVAQGLRPFPREQMLRLSGIVAMQRAGCDLDDRLKVSLDALQGFVFENDEQVAELAVRRIVDPKRPGLRVVFEPIPFDRYGNPTR